MQDLRGLVIPEFLATHMGGYHSEVHQPIAGKIYLFPKFLPFKTQPHSRQQALAPLCLNGMNQGPASSGLPPWICPQRRNL